MYFTKLNRNSIAFTFIRLLIAPLLLTVTSCNESNKRIEHKALNADIPEDNTFAQAVDAPPSAQTLYGMARILAAQQKYSQAEYTLRALIERYPDFAPAYCALAEHQMQKRHIREAESTLRAGLEVCPHDAVILNNIGMCSLIQNDYAEALDYFTKATTVAPDNARYRSNAATALGMMGRFEEALTIYEQLLPPGDAHKNITVLYRIYASKKDDSKASLANAADISTDSSPKEHSASAGLSQTISDNTDRKVAATTKPSLTDKRNTSAETDAKNKSSSPELSLLPGPSINRLNKLAFSACKFIHNKGIFFLSMVHKTFDAGTTKANNVKGQTCTGPPELDLHPELLWSDTPGEPVYGPIVRTSNQKTEPEAPAMVLLKEY
jgi:Tfp pilus assembly protein PilF